MNNILNKYEIKQVYIGSSIKNLCKYFDKSYKNCYEATLFIGLYNEIDIQTITKHNGDKYIFWFDCECNPNYIFRKNNVNYILNNNIIKKHFVNSMNTVKHLNFYNLNYDIIYDYFTDEQVKYKILTNKKLQSIANNLNENLKDLGYSSEIITDLTNDLECKSYVYIIIYIKYFTELKNIPPRKYILYQMEQLGSKMINEDYYSLAEGALKIFDFSESNMKKLNFEQDKYLYNPFPISKFNQNINTSEFDILFYGQFNNRRVKILSYLNKIFNIRYYENIFDLERDNKIKKTKIVLNLHFYENACLETARINECLKFNKIVLSELPNDKDILNKELYNDYVHFFDVIDNNLSNIDKLVIKLNDLLDNYKNLKSNDITLLYKKVRNIFEKNIKYEVENINNDYYYFKTNTRDFISITNPQKWIFNNYEKIRKFDNVIDFDYFFYKEVNNLNLKYKYEILNNIYTEGFDRGLIYHPKQLINIYPNLDFKIFNNKLLINNSNGFDFVRDNIYNKDYNFFLHHFITEKKNTIKNKYNLMIICFIGNLQIGLTLINELNKYEEDFNLCLIYKKDIRIEELETQLKKKEYILFESNNFGTDIIPSLMCYELIKHKFDFKYIIKLHTKSDKTWFNDLTNFLLINKLRDLINYLESSNTNCISHPNYQIKNQNNQCIYLINKYIDILDKNKSFIKGTIFICSIKTFDKVFNFFLKNYKSILFCNMYDSNAINEKKSYIHFLERLFGLIN